MPKYQASEAACAASAARPSIAMGRTDRSKNTNTNSTVGPMPCAIALAVCVALGLSACGGGGGGGNVKSNPPPPPPKPPVVDTSPIVVHDNLQVASGEIITRPIVMQEKNAAIDNHGGTIGGDVDIAIDAKSISLIQNEDGGIIRGGETAIYLEHGGTIHNGVGSTIEATGAGGGQCDGGTPCAIYSGAYDEPGFTLPHLDLTNEGTIIGNVQMDTTVYNSVQLFAGSSIRGDLNMGSAVLSLSGDAGTVQRYSQAVTGKTTFQGGNIYKDGAGTWVIDNSDLVRPGAITLDDGTLRIVDGGSFSNDADAEAPLDIFMRHGELVFDRSEDASLQANLWMSPGESGVLVQAGTGTLTLSEANVLQPSIRIERGTLRIGEDGDASPTGTEYTYSGLNVENEGAFVFDSNMDLDIGGNISGTGSLTQNGSGVVSLYGAQTYTGDTIVNSGGFVASDVLPGNIIVNRDGALFASLAGDLTNAGSVSVTAPSDNTVGGDYVQTSTGVLAIKLGSKLVVAGKATLGGMLAVIGARSGYVANTHTEVLTAAGGVIGTFDLLGKSTGLVFTSNTINYDANSVWLDTTGLNITIAAAGDGIGYTPASMSAAVRTQGAFEELNRKIETNSLAGVSNEFLQSAGQFQQAASIEAAQASLRSLSGQLHAASAAMTFRAIDAGNQALSDHLDNLRDGNAAFGMWTQQLGSGGGMARSGFDGVGFQMDGWLVGNDYRLGRSGVVGFAFGQGQGVQQLQAGADRDASRRTEGMVYAGLTSDRWYAQGRLGFGQFRQDVNRQLLLGNAAEGVWTRYGGRYQVGYGESGLRWNAGNVRIAPFVSMEYARSDRDAFAEEGAGGFGLRSDAQSQARWQAAVGLRAARQWNFGGGRSLDVGAHAQWFRTLGMDGEAMDASFVGLQQWSPLLGIGLSRHGSLAGVGLDARLSPRAMFKLAYDYEQGQYDSAHGMTAALNVAF